MAIVASSGPVSTELRRDEMSRIGCVFAWFAMLVLSLQSLASAQQFQADPLDEKVRVYSGAVPTAVKDASRYAADKDRFLEYFGSYYLPAMTRFGSSELADIGKSRYDLFFKVLWPAASPDLQVDLTKLAFDKMSPVVKSRNYHPAVRYNAILIIGLLDDKYAIDGGANRRPSTPHKGANALLLQIVDAAAKGGPIDPTLLVRALVGLERHAQFHDQLDRPTIDAMTASLLKLVQLEPLLPQADRQVAQWIRLQAATALAKLGSPGAKGEVNAALLKLIDGPTEPKLSLDVRCQIAALFGLLNYQGATVDGKATADTLLKLVSDVTTEEATEAKNFEKLHVGGFNEGPRPKVRTKFTQISGQIEYERRTLLARFGDVRRALEATRAVVPAEEQAKFDAILAAIKPVIDAGANKDEIDLQLAQKIGIMSGEIQRVLNPSAAPATPAEDADVF